MDIPHDRSRRLSLGRMHLAFTSEFVIVSWPIVFGIMLAEAVRLVIG